MPTAFATMACRGAGNQEGIAAARCAFGWSMRQQALHGAAARAIRLPRCVARDRGVAVASIRAWAGLSLTTSTDHIVRTPPAHSTKRSAALHPWTMHLVPTSPYRRFGCFDPPASVFFQWRRRPFAIYMKRCAGWFVRHSTVEQVVGTTASPPHTAAVTLESRSDRGFLHP